MQHFDYQTPECVVFNVLSEGVLCTSTGADLPGGSYIDPYDKVDGSWE